jgi:peptidoglycan/xylan/chitin deacetylase (PgdA/CDA1 family)
MTLLLLRDDDANATTDPARLERTYAPLLDAGVPVCFSTIPEVALDTRAPDGRRESFLHQDTPDSSANLTLVEDSPLAVWLRSSGRAVDVLMHGLTHARARGGTEFGSLTFEEAEARIVRGRAVLRRALGQDPLGFVAPWDALSGPALRACASAFEVVSTSWLGRANLPIAAWPAHVLERLRRREALRLQRCWVMRHRGGKIDGGTRGGDIPAILDSLADGADVAVVVLHHWMYWDRPDPHPAIVALARSLRSRTVAGVAMAVSALERRVLWRTAL